MYDHWPQNDPVNDDCNQIVQLHLLPPLPDPSRLNSQLSKLLPALFGAAAANVRGLTMALQGSILILIDHG